MEQRSAITSEEVAIFEELCEKEDQSDVTQFFELIGFDPEWRLKLLINRRHKYENCEEINGFENSVHEATGPAARAYVAELHANYYAKGDGLPFPELEIDYADASEAADNK